MGFRGLGFRVVMTIFVIFAPKSPMVVTIRPLDYTLLVDVHPRIKRRSPDEKGPRIRTLKTRTEFLNKKAPDEP